MTHLDYMNRSMISDGTCVIQIESNFFIAFYPFVLSNFQFGFVSLHHFDFLKILSAICITIETVTPRQLTLATATYFDTIFCWNNCFSKIRYKNILMINGTSNYNYNKLCGNVLSFKQRWPLAASRKSKSWLPNLIIAENSR